MKEEQKNKQEEISSQIMGNDFCRDRRCPKHGSISIRRRNFNGYIKKIVGNRAVIEWERILYIPKYERYEKRRSKIHSHIPSCILDNIKEGDYVLIGECRPLSKIINSIVLEIIK